jgi:hypothetical protein
MKLRLSLFVLLLLTLAGLTLFLTWAGQRPPSHYLSDLRSQVIDSPRPPGARANLLLIRPQLYPADYQHPQRLRLKLAAALDRARQAGLLQAGTLVALPEHIGTWLLARDEKAEFYQARTRQEVRNWLLLGNPLLATRVLLQNLDADRLDETLLRMKAKQMAQDYQQLFAGLARDYRVTLLAGSILLPEPQLVDGQLRSGNGALRNASLVFASDGEVIGELYSEPWPWRAATGQAQRLEVGPWRLEVERDWHAGHPQSRLHLLRSDLRSPPLYLRGKLDWPIGGATRRIRLIPDGAADGEGSQLLSVWPTPP